MAEVSNDVLINKAKTTHNEPEILIVIFKQLYENKYNDLTDLIIHVTKNNFKQGAEQSTINIREDLREIYYSDVMIKYFSNIHTQFKVSDGTMINLVLSWLLDKLDVWNVFGKGEFRGKIPVLIYCYRLKMYLSKLYASQPAVVSNLYDKLVIYNDVTISKLNLFSHLTRDDLDRPADLGMLKYLESFTFVKDGLKN